MFTVREETHADHATVRRVNEAAFGCPNEADLVDVLRENARPHLSLVAEAEGRVVGHIFFSPVVIEPDDENFRALGLAPMSVLPEFQSRGVGSQLVRRGLEECRKLGYAAVVVVGHAAYYPRFGFVPARAKGLECEYAVPDDVFMVAELEEGALRGRSGLVKYRPEFGAV